MITLREPDQSPVYKTVNGVRLAVHIFQPRGWTANDCRAAVVFFFGGGWTNGTPTDFYPYCRRLADLGLVAMAADYRVKTRHDTRPQEAVQDAKSAVRWLRANAATLGIDPDRLAAGGGSAGGHLALSCLLIDGQDEPGEDTGVSAVPDATATINPVADMTTFDKRAERCGSLAAARAISPRQHIRSGVGPAIIFHGELDELVPLAEIQAFTDAMNAAGNQCELVVRPGKPHGFYKYKDGTNPEFFAVAEGFEKFFQKLKWTT